MNEAITIFTEKSREYKRLLAAAALIESETGKSCKIDNTLFDAGQNWAWTTILIESGMASFPYVQALTPRQQTDIVFGKIDLWLKTTQEIIAKHATK